MRYEDSIVLKVGQEVLKQGDVAAGHLCEKCGVHVSSGRADVRRDRGEPPNPGKRCQLARDDVPKEGVIVIAHQRCDKTAAPSVDQDVEDLC